MVGNDSASTSGPSQVRRARPGVAPSADPLAATHIALGLGLVCAVVASVVLGGSSDQKLVDQLLALPVGRAEAMLVFASGILVSLLHRRLPTGLSRMTLARSGLILIAFGLMLSTVMPASLLTTIGGLVALTPWLIDLRQRTLVIGAGACFILGAASVSAFGDSFVSWAFQRGGFVGLTMQSISTTLFSLYPLVVWAGFYFIGILIGRLDLSERRTAGTMFVGGTVFAILFSVGFSAVNSFVQADDSTAYAAALQACEGKAMQRGLVVGPDGMIRWPNGVTVETESLPAECRPLSAGRSVSAATFTSFEPYSNSTAWSLQATAIVVAVLGLCLLVSRSRLLWPLQALGSIALTGYFLQLAIAADVWTFLNGTAGGREPRLGIIAQLGLLLVLVALMLALSVVIRRRWRYGPVEWLITPSGRDE